MGGVARVDIESNVVSNRSGAGTYANDVLVSSASLVGTFANNLFYAPGGPRFSWTGSSGVSLASVHARTARAAAQTSRSAPIAPEPAERLPGWPVTLAKDRSVP